MAEQFQFFMDKATIDFSRNLEERVFEILKEKKITIAVAESLTGGLVASKFTSQPGSSAYFVGGAVCYTSRAKIIQTGVDPKVIARAGVVSEETALGLARGIRQRLFTNLGVGVTGVAGPKAHDGKPVGTVYVAVVDKDRDIVKEFDFEGEREDIRKKSVQAVLGVLWMYLKDNDK